MSIARGSQSFKNQQCHGWYATVAACYISFYFHKLQFTFLGFLTLSHLWRWMNFKYTLPFTRPLMLRLVVGRQNATRDFFFFDFRSSPDDVSIWTNWHNDLEFLDSQENCLSHSTHENIFLFVCWAVACGRAVLLAIFSRFLFDFLTTTVCSLEETRSKRKTRKSKSFVRKYTVFCIESLFMFIVLGCEKFFARLQSLQNFFRSITS